MVSVKMLPDPYYTSLYVTDSMTPVIKKDRLKLCDDRMMTRSERNSMKCNENENDVNLIQKTIEESKQSMKIDDDDDDDNVIEQETSCSLCTLKGMNKNVTHLHGLDMLCYNCHMKIKNYK